MRAIIDTEGTRGNCKIKGDSGENGCTQHMPETWKQNSKKYLGYIAPQSAINEQYVVALLMADWSKKYTPYQIGLLYNGGQLKEKSGVNKYGVRYDSGSYARRLVSNFTLVANAQE